ncbi:hypothetical protein M2152_000912 [Microbacteriaceae bacterium SG_E_30_P1]|uniref:Uncharacterized protein n=1 Tax=Antiquaquibacter oligotrophicus TaxID=2880260 RepID=A0ABT6KLZ0_9MICO|nr:hypothetical protein [Antiquaquibacter oligotrophicus]MDH6180730.1 hypothetical protein [Antiquaquibacter oligotrophicus]UDF13544.1 hypothetical protein LH407_01440 [Antiquaquibacter oligotrophicus]
MSSEPHPASESSTDDSLVSRLRVIEDQPLETRAAALGQVYDELAARLESASRLGAHD